jgi:hypothetical protein
MSIRSLYIGYSKVEHTTEMVKKTIDEFFHANLVSRVDERIRKDKENNPFKIFFVHFSKVNTALQHFFDKLGKVESLRIYQWTLKFNTRHHLKNETSFLNDRDDTYWTNLSDEFKHDVHVKPSNI